MTVLTGSFGMDLLAVLVSLLAVTIVYFKWSFQYWARKGVQCRPPTIPTGNTANFVLQNTTFGEELQKIYQEFKPRGLRYCGYYFFSKPTLVVFHPDLIKNVLTKDFQHFTDRGIYVNEENDPLTGNLPCLSGLKWKNLRAKLAPTFTSGKMKMMFQTLLNCSDDLVVVMDIAANERQAVDIKDVGGRFTTDVIGSCAFGIECNSLRNPNSEFRKYGERVFEQDALQGIKYFLACTYPKLLDFFKIRLTKSDMSEFFMGVVDDTVTYREKHNVVRKDFLHLLIQLKNNVKIQDDDVGDLMTRSTVKNSEVGEALTMPQLAAQAFVFFGAGFETSSTTLTFCLYELVKNPSIQEKLREEINGTLDKYGGNITYDSLMEMTYMDKCINETLRKYPPASVLTRECTKAYKIPDSNITVPKGMLLFVPLLGLQHDPEYYPDPEKFDPERFSSENKASRPSCTWVPFGEGPRICIGLRFGVMQAKVALTVLLKNYRFGLSSKTVEPLVMDPKSIVLSAKGGVWLTTEKL